MIYLWLKSLHIVAIIIWVGGMLLAAVTVGVFTKAKTASDENERGDVLAMVRRWDRRVTSSAMLTAWGLGLTIAYLGGWFSSPWLSVKIALVLLLSGFHGFLTGTLRRLDHPEVSVISGVWGRSPMMIVPGVLAIVVIVVIKPW